MDSFLKIARLEGLDIASTLEQLDEIGKQFSVKFVISVSLDKEELPQSYTENVSVAL